jgi:IclR family transcriptional regulator, acetate operon repressor
MARALPGTTDRVIALLRCVAETRHGLTLTELSRALDLAPSTIHRMLDRLGALGIVQLDRDGRHYVAGLEFYRLSALVMEQTDFMEIARRDLAGLAEESGETCFLALYMPSERRMMYDSRATGARSIQIATELHAPLPLSSGAAGLAMLSALKPLEIDAVLSGEGRAGGPRATLFEVLAGIRRSGYAFCRDERIADAVEIAAPLSDAAGRMIGALSIAIPETGFSRDSEPLLSRQVMDRAKGLSQRLGDTAIRQERRRVQDWAKL